MPIVNAAADWFTDTLVCRSLDAQAYGQAMFAYAIELAAKVCEENAEYERRHPIHPGCVATLHEAAEAIRELSSETPP